MEARMTEECTCRACGAPLSGWLFKSGLQIPFCSPLCAKAKMLQMRAMGSAIVEIREDGVKCLLCGLHMRAASSHFKSAHGLDVYRGMKRSDRLAQYGLPDGSRLAAVSYREENRDRATAGDFGSRFAASRISGSRRKGVRGPSKPSALQIANASRFGADNLRKYVERKRLQYDTVTCARCGKERRTISSVAKRAKYCTSECAYRHRVEQPDPVCSIDGCGEPMIAKSLCGLHYSRSKKGLDMTAPRTMRAAGKTCSDSGCERAVLAKGLCSTHYQRAIKAKKTAR